MSKSSAPWLQGTCGERWSRCWWSSQPSQRCSWLQCPHRKDQHLHYRRRPIGTWGHRRRRPWTARCPMSRSSTFRLWSWSQSEEAFHRTSSTSWPFFRACRSLPTVALRNNRSSQPYLRRQGSIPQCWCLCPKIWRTHPNRSKLQAYSQSKLRNLLGILRNLEWNLWRPMTPKNLIFTDIYIGGVFI